MKKGSFLAKCFTQSVKVVEQRMDGEMLMDGTAECIMACVKRKVSPVLYSKLVEMLLGIRSDLQKKMAKNLLAFIQKGVAHTTGYVAVDTVLEICYVWIGAEQGFIKKKLTNTLMASKMIDLTTPKAKRGKKIQEPQFIVEPEVVKNPCFLRIKKECRSCKFKCLEWDSRRNCQLTDLRVEPTGACADWEMSDCLMKMGRSLGTVKSKAYLDFVQRKRLAEDVLMEQGLIGEEDRQPVEELRQEYMEKYGSIYVN